MTTTLPNTISLPLVEAARAEDLQALAALAAAGADVHGHDEHGRTALHLAAIAGSAGSCASLIGLGANPDHRTSSSWTPMHLAAYFGRARTCATLYLCGADPAPQDDRGTTPADLAAIESKDDCLLLFMACGSPAPTAELRNPTQKKIVVLPRLRAAVLTNDCAIVERALAQAPDGEAALRQGQLQALASYADKVRKPRVAAFLRSIAAREQAQASLQQLDLTGLIG